ncbi:GH36-type glycosyl hydrolase domain-containing protein [Parasediminibacterium sp. JCM 36343]|uniref:GH36-type glycosyl hydrolase domain-containing protein n=1 Tax=Parasediminibacterium sp. JCM 36343 TaxID=3374279 RepID=UPI00397C7B96
MNLFEKNKPSRKINITGILPYAFASLKKNIIAPIFGGNLLDKYKDELPPFRADLFTLEQIEQYAQKLAKSHVLIEGKPSEHLLERLSENEGILLEVHQLLTESVKQSHPIVPAGEWLLDNFYLIEEQVYTAKKHLPKGYSKGLPQLAKGASEGLPRVYDMAIEMLSHTDGRIDLQTLNRFIEAYQKVTTLRIGELWALPIMFRLALLENLRRLSTQIATNILNKNLADKWADEMTETAEKDPKNLVLVIADMVRSNPPMDSSFVAELTRKLQGKGPSLALPLSWVEQNLSENGLTSTDLVQLENQKQAADQLSISNSIVSLRFLNTTNWRDFVEQGSIVEAILKKDPANVYASMDFFTRDKYRHVVEKISKHSLLSEQDVAKLVVKCAERQEEENAPLRCTHVGYYLIDKGLAQVEKTTKIKLPLLDKLKKVFCKSPLFFYLSGIALLSFLFTKILVHQAYIDGLHGKYIFVLAAICLIAVSQTAHTLINWLATQLANPSLLPSMDFSKGIAEDLHALVVVPTLLTSLDDIDGLLEDLEVRFLGNRDKNLHFALLTDFKDADSETLAEDSNLVGTLSNKTIALNKKYGSENNGFFFLFHRPRKWNAQEKKWMGYERKRGKLSNLNALLRGIGRENFITIIGDETIFPSIKYVITLDTDTKLPRDSAWKMVGTMAHPLNHPLYSKEKQRVVDGYTILQPRVSNSLPDASSSFYAKIHGNEPGTDPYTRAVSDVYQDLFKEGSFIGKGIYDVDAFEHSLNGRFPDNRILSHDLIEGCYARSGFISDVQLYEAYPSNYNADIKRRHRWIRGDWQIARWLLPKVPAPDKEFRKNPLTALSRWKIFDNLRRSMVPLCITFLLLFGWVTGSSWFWTVNIILLFIIPAGLNFGWSLWRKPKEMVMYQHLMYTVRGSMESLFQQILDFAFLPYEAYINTDAILRTAWRMIFSKKKLLEWNPSTNTINTIPKKIVSTFGAMWVAPLLSTGTLFYLFWHASVALIIQLPVLLLWFFSPLLAWVISQNEKSKDVVLDEKQTIYLKALARKIWAFFETFVDAGDNWLPPDNYQEHPVQRIAHRTSPTNIGLSLLSNLTAYDFGYISIGKFIERTTNTFNTIQALEKYRGHLYNWYDTVSLAPLNPRYISTVDSGNFIGHLVTLKQGLLLLPQQKIFNPRAFDGLMDTVNVLMEAHDNNKLIESFKKELEGIMSSYPETLPDAKGCLQFLGDEYAKIVAAYNFKEVAKEELLLWIDLLGRQLNDIHNDLNSLAPWASLALPSAKFNDILSLVSNIPTLQELARVHIELLPHIKSKYSPDNTQVETQWLDAFTNAVIEAGRRAKDSIQTIERLVQKSTDFVTVDYDFLYDNKQHLFTIGYSTVDHRPDNSYYDLLASEARLGIFVSIAQGKIPQETWFALGRQLTSMGSSPVLISWSASMFEYLMPMLVMPSYENTLLNQTHHAIVQKQIDYGRKRDVPWGISESGYNIVDSNLNYQYRAFGVPGLGLKRGLGEDLVISPYSTIMALMVMPEESFTNLKRMKGDGFEGNYGFYEAVDYTASRLPRGQENVVIRSFMAHHQGMSFLSLAYLLLGKPMQKRFEADVQIQATLLLLQERIPRVSTFYSPGVHVSDTNIKEETNEVPIRVITTPHTPVPEVQLLSNGRYHVMVTNAGGGYSRWKDIAITRWREDATKDNWGAFCFIRDLESKEAWSTAYQPLLLEGDGYEAVFSQGRAEFRRKDYQLETHTEIVVSPEDDVELRRVHITNRSRKKRTIEVTSYAEVVLTNQNADVAHTAFSNLFVQTEIAEQRNAIICTRRPRSESEHHPTMFHLMKVHNAKEQHVSYETNRAKFIGRGNTIHAPYAIKNPEPLSNSQGSVLDPIISIQYRIEIEPYQTVIIDMVTGIAETKEQNNLLIEKYQDKFMADRAFELSWTHSQVVLRQINASEPDAQLFGKLASSVIYTNAAMRADASIISQNTRGQSGLWSYSISGDLPIVLLQIESLGNIQLVKQMIQAHAYWRLKGLIVDLVIWNEDHGDYRFTLQNQIMGLIAPSLSMDMKEQPGGVFIRSADQISQEDRILFQAVARLVISDKFGTLDEQLNRRSKLKTIIPYFTPTKFHPSVATSVKIPDDLQFFNGMGGFANNGKEYVIVTKPNQITPAPWCNVLANANFGSIVSESGQAYTWIDNAHEFRLTPWNNDPVSDLAGEAFYIRDEESGKFWSPTPLQARGKTPYITRHGFGYSSFEHSEDGIGSQMTAFVDAEVAVKCIILKLYNQSGRLRKLSATGYVEWVMGEIRPKTQMHTVTETDMHLSCLFARNAYNTELEGRTGFLEVDDTVASFSADRALFIGRNGTLQNPEAMYKSKLSGRSGAALDPCAALQVVFDIADGEEYEIIFKLGAGRNKQDAIEIIQQFKGRDKVYAALEKVKNYWQQTLNVVQIETPDAALNILSNGWLNYQALASRIWGRSGFYQSGGAFGFRDQLQDVLSIMHNKPEIAREQILLNASRQFKEGDAQHWWHPPVGRGVRTTCSDDYLWLPFVTAKYVHHTGDVAILDENVHFLEGRLLNPGEESSYDLPSKSQQTASLYTHCMKAIENGLKFGVHGLPLMGSGDWNDGMDKVGEHGKGESVWLAFFLYDTLMRFSEVATMKNDLVFYTHCIDEAKKLQSNIEQNAWDGNWYKRAFFDDGTPLGSVINDECKIDSIAQSWSVLSKAGNEQHSMIAMKSAAKYLVRKEQGFIQLFNPPFDKSTLNPGYIKGYVPGVRENGGQYTHAAIWLIMGFAALKDRQRTWELLKMVNPINRAIDQGSVAMYKVEPYVMAADVYAEPSNLGRGGWTWYTGSAGWTYQLIIEYVLGLQRKGNELHFEPCFPEEWAWYKISYQYKTATYHIHFIQQRETDKKMTISIDGIEQSEIFVTLLDDNSTHEVVVSLGDGG